MNPKIIKKNYKSVTLKKHKKYKINKVHILICNNHKPNFHINKTTIMSNY